MIGLAFLIYGLPPLALAFVGGVLFPRRWLLAGLGAVLLLVGLFIATSGYSFGSMLPFVSMVGGAMFVPAAIAAFAGAKARRRFAKES